MQLMLVFLYHFSHTQLSKNSSTRACLKLHFSSSSKINYLKIAVLSGREYISNGPH